MTDLTTAPNGAQDDTLRSTFVEMLFALAASEAAIHTAEAIQAPGDWIDKSPALAHLALGLMLIAASWVGWRQSNSPGMKTRVKEIVSMAFIYLLLDVLIVVVYFILIRYVEVKTENDAPILTHASAAPEARMMFAVFGIYMGWDLLTDVFAPKAFPTAYNLWRKLALTIPAAFVSAFASLMCLGLTWVVLTVALRRATATSIILLDVALISLVVLFRLLKLFENWLAGVCRVSEFPAFKTKRDVSLRHWVGGAVFSLLYVGALLAACVASEDKTGHSTRTMPEVSLFQARVLVATRSTL